MARLAFASSFIALSSLLLASCSSAPSGGPPERLGKMRGGIVGGTVDTTHQAVVATFGSQSACTATIVAVVGTKGYALTAAHCLQDAPQVVVQGNDFNSGSSIAYQVTDYQAHPSYNGDVYDFGMIEFTGAGASTPIIGVMTPADDNLQQGSQVEFVGYGVTENGDTTLRHHVSGVLSDVTSLTIEYNQQNGGPCSGDSGGPSLSLVNGVQMVSGVTSYGDQNCTQFGVSGRASAVWTGFIKPFIDGGGGNMNQTCDQCAQAVTTGAGACMPQVDACFSAPACEALVACFNECNDQACYQQCANTNPSGLPLYNEIVDCMCASCATECASAPACQSSSGSGSTTATTGSGTGSGSGSGSGSGVGGAGSSGVGVGGGVDPSSGAWNSDEDDDDDKKRSDSGDTGGCSVSASSDAASPAGLLLALGAALAASRRRRRPR